MGVRLHGLKSGKLLKEFVGNKSFVHSCIFSSDQTQIWSASADSLLKLYDVKTTECLATHTIKPPVQTGIEQNYSYPSSSLAAAILSLSLLSDDRILVTTYSSSLYIISATDGHVINILSQPHITQPDNQQLQNKNNKSKEMSIGDSAAFAIAGGIGAGTGVSSSGTSTDSSSLLLSAKSGGEFVCSCISVKGLYIYGLSVDSILYTFDSVTGKLIGRMKTHKSEGLAIAAHPIKNILTTAAQDSTVKIWKP